MPIANGNEDVKTNYAADIALLGSSPLRFRFGLLLLILIALPFLLPSYLLHLINIVALTCLGALALNLLTGYTGIISLGHGGFLAIGAFTTAALVTEFKLPVLVALPAAVVGGAIAGFFAGLPTLRLRAGYVILSTLAIHFVILAFAHEYQTRTGLIGGFRIPSPSIGPWTINTVREWYFSLLVITGMVTLFCINLVRSRVGRAWMAIRDRDIVAMLLGVHIGYYKLLAFMFSSALAAFAGCLGAFYLGFTTASDFTIWTGIFYLAMIIVGGQGSIMGSFLGAFFIALLPYGLSDLCRILNVPSWLQLRLFAVQYAVLGLLISFFLIVEPRGLVAIWYLRIRPYFALWPFKHRR